MYFISLTYTITYHPPSLSFMRSLLLLDHLDEPLELVALAEIGGCVD